MLLPILLKSAVTLAVVSHLHLQRLTDKYKCIMLFSLLKTAVTLEWGGKDKMLQSYSPHKEYDLISVSLCISGQLLPLTS